jgi:hypothetical protein
MREPELPGYVYIMAATNDAMVLASIADDIFQDDDEQMLLDDGEDIIACLVILSRRMHYRIKNYVEEVVARYSLDDFQDTFRYVVYSPSPEV